MSDLMIYKHNELIENFIFNATFPELQIMNYAVATTNPQWENKNLVYMISIPDLVSLYKIKSNNAYKHYREALSKLMRREYSYYAANGDLVTENLVTRTRRNEKDTSWLEFRFNDYISSRVAKLDELFTSYNIKHIAMFKSRYAFMLYEYFKINLDQANYCGSPIYRKKITVAEFKESLDLVGKYKVFRDLETKVLKVAKQNINEYSDIRMSYSVTRKARTPTHIVLSAQYKKGREIKSPEEQEEIPDLDKPDENYIQPTAEQIAKRKSDLKNILR
jgi:plasmid replication initiation protein